MTDKSLKEIFVGARELLSDPAKWGKGAYFDPQHNCYCLLGACAVAGGIDETSLIEQRRSVRIFEDKIIPVLTKCLPKRAQPGNMHGHMSGFNDNKRTTHADILAVLDCAIKCCDENPS